MSSVTERNLMFPRASFGGRRDGLTTVEFMGCIVAVIGGAWLGALYLGVDVRHVAHAALVEADMLEKVPPEWRPPGPKEKSLSREQLVNTLRQELSSLRHEIAAIRVAELEPGNSVPLDDPTALVRDKTLAYWQRVNEIALGEMALQQDAEVAFDEANAAKVFAIKGRISKFTANAVAAVPKELVDSSVVQLGDQLKDWYERSGQMYDRAVEIWDLPATNDTRVRLYKDWRATELHHRNEARLLHERAARVRSSISRQFGKDFPDFAKPLEKSPSVETSAAAG